MLTHPSNNTNFHILTAKSVCENLMGRLMMRKYSMFIIRVSIGTKYKLGSICLNIRDVLSLDIIPCRRKI